MADRYTVFVVPHTHWDRAWYVPFQEFRLRLVRLIDRVCDTLDSDPEFTTFALDGQSIVLEDYLEIRPENAERLRTLIKKKRLQVGPWYVLPDEYLVSPESIIRNLMLGRSIARQFGRVMDVGYVPDPFGHIAQLPQILQGFGLDTFVFARGIDTDTTDLKLEFYWSAPDGSRVLALHQRNFYNNAAFLGYRIVWGDSEMLKPEPELAIARIQEACDKLRDNSVTGILLLNNGVDHSEHQPELPALIAEARKQLPQYTFRIASFEDYAKTVKRQLNGMVLQKKSGELYYDYGDMLHGVYSTRIHLKQRNRRAQDLLEKEAEPLAALAWLTASAPYAGSELQYAWKTLIKNHPHDDICGCSVDQVHRDMEHRFDQVDIVGGYVARESLRAVARELDHTSQDGIPVMVFNPLATARHGVQDIAIDLIRAHEPWKTFQLFDEKGRELPYERIHSGREFWMETGKGFDVERHHVRLALDLPPCGYRTLYVREGQPIRLESACEVGPARFENAWFRLTIGDTGAVAYTDKKSGVRYAKLLTFEDREDCGDEYNWSFLPKPAKAITSDGVPAKVRLLHKGPLGATWRITQTLKVPEGLSADRATRSPRTVPLTIESEITCRADSPRVDVVTRVHNTACDHRLRVRFPTAIETDTVAVDGHCALLERSIEAPPPAKLPPYTTQHQRRFATLLKGNHGFSVINDGLPEFEIVRKGRQRIIALTLFRSVGTLSRDDYPTRPMAAGPPIATPGAQCLQPLEFRYAFLGHDDAMAPIMHQALCHNIPPLVSRCDVHGGTDVKQMGIEYDPFLMEQPLLPVPREGSLPNHGSFIDLGSPNLRLSALKKCEHRNTLIVRFYNPFAEPVRTTVNVFRPIKQAWETNLEEKRERVLRTVRGRLSLTCPAYKIMTLELALD